MKIGVLGGVTRSWPGNRGIREVQGNENRGEVPG